MYWFDLWCLQPTSHSMSNTSILTHSQLCRNYIISILPLLLSLSLFAFHTLPHLLQHMPTHTAPQAHVIWNCIFPSFSLLSLSCPSHLALLSVSHTCAGTLKTRFPFEMSLQLSPSSGPLSLLFIPSAIQIKTMLYCLDWEETCAAHFISWPILFY